MSRTKIDDTDRRIEYSSEWFVSGRPDDFNKTVHGTRIAGSTATFKFRGNYIAAYGAYSSTKVFNIPAQFRFDIDGQEKGKYVAPLGEKNQYQQEYFKTDLPDGDHTLLITSQTQDAFFWLDYLEVGETGKAALAPGSTPNSNSNSTSNGPPVGAIVGSVVGALALIGLLAFFFLRRKKTQKAHTHQALATSDDSWRADGGDFAPRYDAAAAAAAPLPGTAQTREFNPRGLVGEDERWVGTGQGASASQVNLPISREYNDPFADDAERQPLSLTIDTGYGAQGGRR